MTCKNCGADLKPGIKYCLECGEYIEEDNDDMSTDEAMDMVFDNTDSSSTDYSEPVPKTKKKKTKMSDLIIYIALGSVIVISIIVIIVASVNDKKKNVVTPEPSPVYTDKTVSVDDYKIKISGKLSYDVQGSIISISDNENFSFNYRNNLDDYNKYANDLTLLSKDLQKSNYQLLNTEKRKVGSHEFLIYKIIANSKTKYLYVTQVNVKYVTMGIIEMLNNSSVDVALEAINKINDNIVFDTIYS